MLIGVPRTSAPSKLPSSFERRVADGQDLARVAEDLDGRAGRCFEREMHADGAVGEHHADVVEGDGGQRLPGGRTLIPDAHDTSYPDRVQRACRESIAMNARLLIDFLTVHRSGRNRAPVPRWTMQLRYFNFAEPTGAAFGWAG